MSSTAAEHHGGELFVYENLVKANDIRVLRLQRGQQVTDQLQDPIVGQLRHVSLDDYVLGVASEQYTAISYCWGDPTPADRIWLGQNTYLPIGASAAYILRHVSSEHEIWIDSVCINQADDAEKSSQVAIMWDVFKYAAGVAIWLGGPEDDAVLAMHLIFDIVHNEITAQRLVANNFQGRRPIFLWHFTAQSDDYHEPSWRALAKLLDRPWFRRTWILQEVVANNHTVVFCAGEQLAWDDFVELINKMRVFHCQQLLVSPNPTDPEARDVLPRGVASIDRIEELRRTATSSSHKPSLESNLLMTVNYESTDPRDKIFAILSFSHEHVVPGLQPRYDRSVCDVYTDATRYLLCRQESLRILHFAGIGWNRSHSHLPSWVPDYSRSRADPHSGQTSYIHASTLHGALLGVEAGDSFWVRLNIHIHKVTSKASIPRAICVSGIVMDEVRVVCQGLSLRKRIWNRIISESHDDRLEILSWYNRVSRTLEGNSDNCTPHSRTKHQHSISGTEAFWSTLTVDLVLESSATTLQWRATSFPDSRAYGRQCFKAFLGLLLFSVASKPGKLDLAALDRHRLNMAKQYIERLEQVQDWTVFITTKGYLGRGPPLMQEGDRVCVFFGAKSPFIVRNAFTHWFVKRLPLNVYQLVGECFVSGLMYGEALREITWSNRGKDIWLV